MRLSRMFGKTLRQNPADAETVSHRYLVKGGLIHQLSSGLYSYLPLAQRSLTKIQAILREEMDNVGAQELQMPALQPLELWEQTGRAEAFGASLFRVSDRKGRQLVLAPTHEETVTSLVKNYTYSYRDLPLILYQIQTKFRDEARPRAGLVRVREFAMKDAYSFDIDDVGLDASYNLMVQAYNNIFDRCGLPVLMVEADSGAIGGKDSQEFILPSENGEDTIIRCTKCSYAANAERARGTKTPEKHSEQLQPQEVFTPGIKTIRQVADYLQIPTDNILKAVLYIADEKLVFVTIRGDLEVNEVKLANVLKCRNLRLAVTEEVEAYGLIAGWASAIGLKGIRTIADDSISLGSNYVVGANRKDYHMININYPRDFEVDMIVDIALAQSGQGCIHCGGVLNSIRGIEVGHVFKLGGFFTKTLDATYLDHDGTRKPILMGCYGIGVGRLLAAAIEQNHDDKGIIFPPAIAPYQVQLIAVQSANERVKQASEDLSKDLESHGIEVLYDDREESPGVKFNDGDLLGMPVLVVVSERNLSDQVVEIRRRTDQQSVRVNPSQVVATVKKLLGKS